MKGYKKSKLSRYVLAALTVGMFSMVPMAYALPVQDTTNTNTAGSAINTSVANQMGITSTVANNVMNWKTFSIANGEKVQFDTNNYLNLVRGTSKSEIDGNLSGGGNIYLINPNGILFGTNARVNVGNLVASTRAITDADQTTFLAGNNPITTNTAGSAAGDIVNLGKLQTTSVILEGNNITIQNAADITSDGSTPLTSTVTAKAAGIITVGHEVTATTTRSFTINGTATAETVHDYKNATVASSGYTGKKLDGTTDNAIKESMLVDNVYDLQNMDAKLSSDAYHENTIGNYMLAGDIDASDTENWNSGAGFSPVGSEKMFDGTFDGANHTIKGLYINRPTMDHVGLFGWIYTDTQPATIQNVGLVKGSIAGQGSVGGVVGESTSGTITNVYNTGTVSGTGEFVGGVVGYAYGGKITNAYNSGSVKSTNVYVGGVVGYIDSGTITNVHNEGMVEGTGAGYVGGVVGYIDSGTITNAYNTGTISGTDFNIGGIAGYNSGTIMNAYNTGTVKGNTVVGGIVGENGGTITNAYNTGTVSGTNYVGGIVGGEYAGTISNVYNTGEVSSEYANVGGVMGETRGGTISNALWANDLSYTPAEGYNKPTKAVGKVDDTATVKGAALADMKKATTYDSWTDDSSNKIVATTGNAGTAWRIYEGYTTPLLTSLFKGVITVTGRTVEYNGQNQTVDISQLTFAPALSDTSHIFLANSVGRNVGAYGSLYSDQQGYDFVNTSTLTISPKTLTATLTGKNGTTYTFTKAYDGTTSMTQALGNNYIFAAGDVISGDVVSIAANNNGVYTDNKNVANDKAIKFTGITLTGADAGNYTIAGTLSGNVGQITKKDITAALTGTNSISKEYDGNTNVTTALTKGTNYNFVGLVDNDDLKLTGTGKYTDKKAGNDKTVVFSELGLTGADAGNYNLTSEALSSEVGRITKKDISATLIGTNSISKEYDGNTDVKAALIKDANYQFTGLVDKDALGLTGTGIYTDNKNVANGKPVSFTGLSLTGTDSENYTLTNTSLTGTVGQITKKTITAILADNTFNKVYDGNTIVSQALDNNYSLNGVISGDAANVSIKDSATNKTGVYNDKKAGNGKGVTFTVTELTGDEANNYELSSTSLSGKVGNITQKDLTATLLNGQSIAKKYDGTTVVTASLAKDQNYSLPDLVSGDVVTLTVSGTYDNKNVGTGKQVSFTGLGLTGADAGNYNLKTKELSGAIGQIDQKAIAAELKSGSIFTKDYDGTDVVTTALVKDTNYVLPNMISGDDLSLDTAKISGTYTAGKDVGNYLSVIFTGLKLTGKDAGNYDLLDSSMGDNYGKITPKALTATLTGDNVFTKVYDGTTAVSQALGTNYTLNGIVADSDKVSLSAGSGAYNDKNVGNSKTITFSGLTLTGTGAGNYTIASTLSGAVGQITRKTITGTLASGYSFDKVYDGTTTASLGNGYTLSGVVAGDKVPLTAANGFYDSSAIGDRTVTFSGFSINDGNYLLSMADSLSGTGKITSGSQDHNYNDALVGFGSFFDTDPAEGMTIFRSNPEDYIPRAVSQNNGQSYKAGVTQVTQTWYNGPATITIINGGITLPKDILLGSTYDTRTVVIKGGNSYEI